MQANHQDMQEWKRSRETETFKEYLISQRQELLTAAMNNIDKATVFLPMAKGIDGIINYLEDKQ